MNDPPPAEILRRLRPIPTYRDHPATSAADVEGVDPSGAPARVGIVGAAEPVLLLFLSSGCLGCRDLWEGGAALRQALPDGVRVVQVTRDPDAEDARVVAGLAQPGTLTVMSTTAYHDYRVGGPPFLVVVSGDAVRTEGVAWGIAETARATRQALESEPR